MDKKIKTLTSRSYLPKTVGSLLFKRIPTIISMFNKHKIHLHENRLLTKRENIKKKSQLKIWGPMNKQHKLKIQQRCSVLKEKRKLSNLKIGHSVFAVKRTENEERRTLRGVRRHSGLLQTGNDKNEQNLSQENNGPNLLNLKRECGHLPLRTQVTSNKQGGTKKFKAIHLTLIVYKSLSIQI